MDETGPGVRLSVLDLFSGLGGWSRPFKDRGHEVTTLDADQKYGADWRVDIRIIPDLAELGEFEVVLASPPCETFSVASIGTHWAGGHRAYRPKTGAAYTGLAVMEATFRLIDQWAGKDGRFGYYVIENPRGMMRKLAPRPPTTTVWYCKFGDTRAKPTDLWTNIPVGLPRACKNNNPLCDHQRAPRGAKTGTQGRGADRALIPYGLALTFCLAAESALDVLPSEQLVAL